MAMLTLPLSGDLEVLSFGRRNTSGGQLRRTINGQLRGDKLWKAREWRADVLALTDAAAQSIYMDAADGEVDVEVNGDLVEGSAVVRIEVLDDDYQKDGTGYVRVLSLMLREQA